jgi:hypothetical protein
MLTAKYVVKYEVKKEYKIYLAACRKKSLKAAVQAEENTR